MASLKVRKGDRVHILSGEDKGKTGKILEVRPRSGKVLVDGMNIQKKHTRPSQSNPQGSVVPQPGPIDVSNVALVCPSCPKPTRISTESSGKDVVRSCKRCGKTID